MENAGFLKWNTRKGLIWPWGRVGELGVGKGLGETGDLAFWQASGCTWLVLIWLENSSPPQKKCTSKRWFPYLSVPATCHGYAKQGNDVLMLLCLARQLCYLN